MKKNLTYQKPGLRGMDLQDVAGLCISGTAASGTQFALTQCNNGGTADFAGPVATCGSGNADTNNYYSTCNSGSSISAGNACTTGFGV